MNRQLGLLLFCVVCLVAQQPSTSSDTADEQGLLASVSGRVTNSAGKPIAGVMVALMPLRGGMYGHSAFSNDQGEYVIADVLPDAYFLRVSKDGYAAVFYASRGPGSSLKEYFDLKAGDN